MYIDIKKELNAVMEYKKSLHDCDGFEEQVRKSGELY